MYIESLGLQLPSRGPRVDHRRKHEKQLLWSVHHLRANIFRHWGAGGDGARKQRRTVQLKRRGQRR